MFSSKMPRCASLGQSELDTDTIFAIAQQCSHASDAFRTITALAGARSATFETHPWKTLSKHFFPHKPACDSRLGFAKYCNQQNPIVYFTVYKIVHKLVNLFWSQHKHFPDQKERLDILWTALIAQRGNICDFLANYGQLFDSTLAESFMHFQTKHLSVFENNAIQGPNRAAIIDTFRDLHEIMIVISKLLPDTSKSIVRLPTIMDIKLGCLDKDTHFAWTSNALQWGPAESLSATHILLFHGWMDEVVLARQDTTLKIMVNDCFQGNCKAYHEAYCKVATSVLDAIEAIRQTCQKMCKACHDHRLDLRYDLHVCKDPPKPIVWSDLNLDSDLFVQVCYKLDFGHIFRRSPNDECLHTSLSRII